MEDKGKVVGIEHIPELYSTGLENVSKSFSGLLQDGTILLINGDGQEGYRSEAPYNCIHVGAGRKIC